MTWSMARLTRGYCRSCRRAVTRSRPTTFEVGQLGAYTLTLQNVPLEVSVSPDIEFPVSGDTVTLTATATSAPAGAAATYKWEEKVDGTWENLASTGSTHSVGSAESDVRFFRATVRYGDLESSAEAEVVWDEVMVFLETLESLGDRLAEATSHQTAETALLQCVNDAVAGVGSDGGVGAAVAPSSTIQFGNIDSLYNGYTGATKTIVDSCDAQHGYFGAVHSVVQAEVIQVAAASELHSKWLATTGGQDYVNGLGSPPVVKAMMKHISENVIDEPPVTGTGLDCIGDAEPATEQGKIDALNCLVFDTPHSFWLNSGDSTILSANRTADKYNWLGFGDWSCSTFADGPVPSCKKHDVAYGTLQRMSGENNHPTEELDEAWNPRNKNLADRKARADINKYGCQDSTDYALWILRDYAQCVSVHSQALIPAYLAAAKLGDVCGDGSVGDLMYRCGFGGVNHKGWPVTQQDLADADLDNDPQFAFCDSPQLPLLSNATAIRSGTELNVGLDRNGRVYRETSTYESRD